MERERTWKFNYYQTIPPKFKSRKHAGYKSQPKKNRTSSTRSFEDILLNFFEMTWACADGLFHLGAFIDFFGSFVLLLKSEKVSRRLKIPSSCLASLNISSQYWHFSDPLWKFSQWNETRKSPSLQSNLLIKIPKIPLEAWEKLCKTAKLMTYPEFLRACTINWWYDSSFTPKSPKKNWSSCLNPWTPTETCYLLSDDEFNSPTHYHVCAHWSSRASATSSRPVYLSILKIVILTFCWFGLSLGFFVSWDFSWMKQMRCIVSWCIIN